MNWYWVIAVVSAFLLGWAIGIWKGTENGYASAAEEYQQQQAQQQWTQYFNQFKGGKDEQHKENE